MTAVAGGRQARTLAALTWSAATVSAAGFFAAWILAAGNGDLFKVSAPFGPDQFLVAYPVVGTVLTARRRSNPIGWILLGMGLSSAARALAGQYALHVLAGPARPAAGVWAVWYVDWSLSLLFPAGLLAFLVLLFPDGRPLTTRWRAVGWLAVGFSAIYLVVTWLGPGSIALGSGLPSVPNPTAVPALIHVARNSPVDNGIWVLGFIALLAAAASLVIRYRRSLARSGCSSNGSPTPRCRAWSY